MSPPRIQSILILIRHLSVCPTLPFSLFLRVNDQESVKVSFNLVKNVLQRNVFHEIFWSDFVATRLSESQCNGV